MNARILVPAALVALCLALTLGVAYAEDDVKVVGTVSVATDDDGNVTAIKLVTDDVTYNITLCENGRKLGGMNGKKVEVTGTVTEKDDAKWIAVKSCKAIEEEKEE